MLELQVIWNCIRYMQFNIINSRQKRRSKSFAVLTNISTRIIDDVAMMKSQVIRVGTSVVARCDSLWEMRDISCVCSDDERRDKERRSRGLHSSARCSVNTHRAIPRLPSSVSTVRDYNALARWAAGRFAGSGAAAKLPPSTSARRA